MIAKVSWFNFKKGFGLAEKDGVRYFLHHTRMDSETLKTAEDKTNFEGRLIEFETEPGATARGIAAKNIRFA
ncbi:MAG: hypothetical protein ACD_5C00094G0003 [uncultured bacterium]|nr:MAG: hypothetical protein ACD_5C00094G0003 [uncultured bacterium]